MDRPDYPRMQLAVLRGEDPGGVIWQPRLDYWYAVNKKRGMLPAPLRDASLEDVYDYCQGSCRYYVPEAGWLRVRYRTVEVTSEWEDDKRQRTTWRTPVGSLTQLSHYDEWNITAHTVEYRAKSPEDFAVLRYILEDEEWYWDAEAFRQSVARFGALGAPQFYFRRSPVQRLFIDEMGLRDAIYFMTDYPELLEEYVEFATAADDAMYEALCGCPVDILNLGENIDGFIDPPPIWRKHLVPYYTRRLKQLHAAGKLVHIHVDGVMRPLLKHLQAVPFDAIEAATPEPQGDVTLPEIKAALGDMALLDGIPALYFLPDQYSVETLLDCAKQVIDLFYPRLILGVSDEVPPDSDIERLRTVGELVANAHP